MGTRGLAGCLIRNNETWRSGAGGHLGTPSLTLSGYSLSSRILWVIIEPESRVSLRDMETRKKALRTRVSADISTFAHLQSSHRTPHS